MAHIGEEFAFGLIGPVGSVARFGKVACLCSQTCLAFAQFLFGLVTARFMQQQGAKNGCGKNSGNKGGTGRVQHHGPALKRPQSGQAHRCGKSTQNGKVVVTDITCRRAPAAIQKQAQHQACSGAGERRNESDIVQCAALQNGDELRRNGDEDGGNGSGRSGEQSRQGQENCLAPRRCAAAQMDRQKKNDGRHSAKQNTDSCALRKFRVRAQTNGDRSRWTIGNDRRGKDGKIQKRFNDCYLPENIHRTEDSTY